MRQAVVGLVSAITLAALLGVAGARVNTTASVPVGLYWQLDRLAEKGDLVLFCPAGSGALIKRVVAVAGDWVKIASVGILVNDIPLRTSTQRLMDPAGRPLPAYRANGVLPEGQLLLMSDQHAASFDARYFGPVAATHLRGVVVPVWVLGREAAR